jgi:hypothetical protein
MSLARLATVQLPLPVEHPPGGQDGGGGNVSALTVLEPAAQIRSPISARRRIIVFIDFLLLIELLKIPLGNLFQLGYALGSAGNRLFLNFMLTSIPYRLSSIRRGKGWRWWEKPSALAVEQNAPARIPISASRWIVFFMGFLFLVDLLKFASETMFN